MKILVVGNYFYPEHTGGIEIVSYNLVEQYREFGHDVSWMAADVPPNRRKIVGGDIPIRSLNFTEERLGFPSPIPRFADLPKVFAGVKWCDAVHLHDCLYPINIMAFFYAKALGKATLITQHAKFIPYKQTYKKALQIVAYALIGRWMFRLADRIVFATTNVRDNMTYLAPKRSYEMIPLGVDTNFFTPLSSAERVLIRHNYSRESERPIILFVGRMVERKGVHLLRSLIEKHQEWNWVLVGRPDDVDPTEWNYPNLTYLPYVDIFLLCQLYGAADLLVHPSVGEGITLTVAECLASGTPVLLSKESLYEVPEERRKLFFAVEPTVDDVEKGLVRAFADRQSLSDLRIYCREYAMGRFSWKKIADRYLMILKGLL